MWRRQNSSVSTQNTPRRFCGVLYFCSVYQRLLRFAILNIAKTLSSLETRLDKYVLRITGNSNENEEKGECCAVTKHQSFFFKVITIVQGEVSRGFWPFVVKMVRRHLHLVRKNSRTSRKRNQLNPRKGQLHDLL